MIGAGWQGRAAQGMAQRECSTLSGCCVQTQLAALDSQYQQKIIAEMERYQELIRDRDALNRTWVKDAMYILQHAVCSASDAWHVPACILQRAP